MANEGFNFSTFIQESKDALLKPKEYFSTMKISGGFGEPIIKALIYGAVAGIFALIWSVAGLGATAGLFGGAIGVMAFIGSIIGAIIGLFIGAVIILLISMICGGEQDFEANTRVSASLMVLMPVGAFLGFFTGISFILGALITLAIRLYGLWMLFHALKGVLKGKEESAKIVGYVLAALVGIMFIVAITAKRAANKFMRGGSKYLKEYEKQMENLQEELEESSKSFRDATEEMEEEEN